MSTRPISFPYTKREARCPVNAIGMYAECLTNETHLLEVRSPHHLHGQLVPDPTSFR